MTLCRLLLLSSVVTLSSRHVESFSLFSVSSGAGKPSRNAGNAVPPAPQLLQFTEPQTNVTVVLVGAMHYNPASVKLTEDTIRSLGNRNMLGSVIVESCDIRWNKTMQLYNEKPLLKRILNNEMRTASDIAVSYDRPVVLGDQRINITTDALKSSLKQTVTDLVTPPTGWVRFADEVGQAWKETVPLGGDGYLSAFSFFDPRLILVLPISLVKYPLSYLVRDPVPTSIVLSSLFALSYFDDPHTMDELMSSSVPLSDYVLSFVVAFLETAVFARLLLKPLLAERNVLLAQSILEQCKLYSSTTKAAADPGWFGFFAKPNVNKSAPAVEVIYAPESPSMQSSSLDGDQKVVVAVLGMAHCNGIMKLLKEQRV
jgi:hypothetical protein